MRHAQGPPEPSTWQSPPQALSVDLYVGAEVNHTGKNGPLLSAELRFLPARLWGLQKATGTHSSEQCPKSQQPPHAAALQPGPAACCLTQLQMEDPNGCEPGQGALLSAAARAAGQPAARSTPGSSPYCCPA